MQPLHEALITAMEELSSYKSDKALMNSVQGISPAVAAKLYNRTSRSHNTAATLYDKLYTELIAAIQELPHHQGATLYLDEEEAPTQIGRASCRERV